MAELHTNDLTNLRLIKSHFLFHEIFLQLLSFLMKMTAMMAAARRVWNARRESTKMSTLISLTRISAGHSGRLVAPSSCKMGHHVTQPRKSSNGLMIILGSLFCHGLHRVLIWISSRICGPCWSKKLPSYQQQQTERNWKKGFCQLGRTLKEDMMPSRIFVIQCPNMSLPWSSLEEVQ